MRPNNASVGIFIAFFAIKVLIIYLPFSPLFVAQFMTLLEILTLTLLSRWKLDTLFTPQMTASDSGLNRILAPGKLVNNGLLHS